ncbi:MAG: transposase family protein, partial [Desulfobacteraceae bacterium]|nr:transposase family protein [Desulfobacteraceae bacterium]
EEGLVFPEGIGLWKDTGFQGYEPDGVNTFQPKKKPRNGEFSIEEKVENSVISRVRIVVEHVISGVFRNLSLTIRHLFTKEKFDDLVMEIACGLHNFRTECRQHT